jgi:membrane protein DedA with SNARE-associated domain
MLTLTPITASILPYLAMVLTNLLEGLFRTLAGGITVFDMYLRPLPAFAAVVTGNLVADMAWYSLGRYSKLDWIKRLGPRFGVNLQIIDEMELEIQKHAPRFLFLAKLTVGLPVPSLIATGLSKVPVRRWIGMLLLAELIRTSVFISLIFLYASAIGQASNEMQVILLTMTGIVVISGMFWWKKRHRNKFQK